MAFRSFQEYLTHDKKIKTPATEMVPDYKGPNSSTPPKAEVDKNAGGAKSKIAPKPYMANNTAKNPNKSSDGLADMGDKGLVYEPETVVKSSEHEKLPTWPKTTSVSEWLRSTKNMSNASFISGMRNETNNMSYGQIKEAVHLCSKSQSNMSQLVMELKRNNLIDSFLSEACKHENTIKAIIEEIKVNNTFQKIMNEMGYMDGDSGGEEEDDELKLDDGEESDEDMDGEDEGDDMDDEGDDMDGDDMDDEGDDEDMDDEGDEDMDGEGDEGENGGGDEGDDENGGGDEDESALSKSIGGKHRHHHHARKILKKMGPAPEPVDEI